MFTVTINRCTQRISFITYLCEDTEKDKWNTDGEVNKVAFSNHYKDLCYVLPDTGNMYCIEEEDVVIRRHMGGSIKHNSVYKVLKRMK